MREMTTAVCNGCGTSAPAPMKMTTLDGLLPPEVPFVRPPRGWWCALTVWPEGAETDAATDEPALAMVFVCPGCAELGRFQGCACARNTVTTAKET